MSNLPQVWKNGGSLSAISAFVSHNFKVIPQAEPVRLSWRSVFLIKIIGSSFSFSRREARHLKYFAFCCKSVCQKSHAWNPFFIDIVGDLCAVIEDKAPFIWFLCTIGWATEKGINGLYCLKTEMLGVGVGRGAMLRWGAIIHSAGFGCSRRNRFPHRLTLTTSLLPINNVFMNFEAGASAWFGAW